jgi:hypothetical protein
MSEQFDPVSVQALLDAAIAARKLIDNAGVYVGITKQLDAAIAGVLPMPEMENVLPVYGKWFEDYIARIRSCSVIYYHDQYDKLVMLTSRQKPKPVYLMPDIKTIQTLACGHTAHKGHVTALQIRRSGQFIPVAELVALAQKINTMNEYKL